MVIAQRQTQSNFQAASICIEAGFDFLSGEYASLFAESDATAFQHPIWLSAFYRDLVAKRNAKPLVIVGRTVPEGKLVFVLPMILRKLAGVTLLETTDLGVTDYAAPVVDRDWLVNGQDSIAPQIGVITPRYDVLHIRSMRDEHVHLWRTFFDQTPQRHDFSAHALDLSGAGAEWRSQALTAEFRKRLERKRRKFASTDNARIRVLHDPNEAAAAIVKLAALRTGRFEGDMIAFDFVRDFYANVASRGGVTGFAATYAVEVADDLAGVAFAIAHGGRLNYLLIGCDYARHGGLSPGILIYDRMIDDWVAAGGTVYDFTIGDEPFKSDFGTKSTAMWEMMHVATLHGRLFTLMRDARRQMKMRLGRASAKDAKTGQAAQC